MTLSTSLLQHMRRLHLLGCTTLLAMAACSSTEPTVPPVAAPGAPSNVSAIAGDEEATVSWNAPDSEGGSAINGYVVTTHPGDALTYVADKTTAVVKNLVNGQSYTFTVRATNPAGSGVGSTPSNAVRPRVQIDAEHSTVKVSQSPAPADGQTPVTVTFRVRNSRGELVAGEYVACKVDDAHATISPAEGLTEEDGTFVCAVRSSFERTFVATASVGIETTIDLTASVEFVSPYCGGHLALESKASTFAVGGSPVGIASADFNLDGRLDFVTANAQTNDVSVRLAKKDGSFEDAFSVGAGQQPVALVTSDFNHDNIPDLAVANYSDGAVQILLGNGDGTFSSLTTCPMTNGGGPNALTVGDFNRDGHVDLATSNANGEANILLGKGTGDFEPAASLPTDGTPLGIATGDIDGDGVLDLVTVSYSLQQIQMFFGKGDGTFLSALVTGVGAEPKAIAMADLNEDGWSDVIVTNSADDNVTILLWTPGGSFERAATLTAGHTPVSVQAVDLDKDGHIDLAVANLSDNNVIVYRGAGDGTFKPGAPYATQAGPNWLTTGDFDGDGYQDLTVAMSDNNVALLVNTCEP